MNLCFSILIGSCDCEPFLKWSDCFSPGHKRCRKHSVVVSSVSLFLCILLRTAALYIVLESDKWQMANWQWLSQLYVIMLLHYLSIAPMKRKTYSSAWETFWLMKKSYICWGKFLFNLDTHQHKLKSHSPYSISYSNKN